MGRPKSFTLLALAIGALALLTTFAGIGAAIPGFCIKGNPWLGASLLATAMLGFRAARRIWRQHPASAQAVVAFSIMVALNLIVMMTAPGVPPQRFRTIGLATVGFLVAGLLAARKVASSSTRPA